MLIYNSSFYLYNRIAIKTYFIELIILSTKVSISPICSAVIEEVRVTFSSSYNSSFYLYNRIAIKTYFIELIILSTKVSISPICSAVIEEVRVTFSSSTVIFLIFSKNSRINLPDSQAQEPFSRIAKVLF